MKFRALATEEQSYWETGNREGGIRENDLWGKDKNKQDNE